MKKLTTAFEFCRFTEGPLAVVLFSAPWCAPCAKIKPALSALADDVPHVGFGVVDIGELPQLAQNYTVRSVPTVFVFRNGILCREMTSNVTVRRILKMVKEL